MIFLTGEKYTVPCGVSDYELRPRLPPLEPLYYKERLACDAVIRILTKESHKPPLTQGAFLFPSHHGRLPSIGQRVDWRQSPSCPTYARVGKQKISVVADFTLNFLLGGWLCKRGNGPSTCGNSLGSVIELPQHEQRMTSMDSNKFSGPQPPPGRIICRLV